MLTATNQLLRHITITSLWKCNELIVTQQELLRYYGNAAKGLTCQNTIAGPSANYSVAVPYLLFQVIPRTFPVLMPFYNNKILIFLDRAMKKLLGSNCSRDEVRGGWRRIT
jgi:hypothetical protein